MCKNHATAVRKEKRHHELDTIEGMNMTSHWRTEDLSHFQSSCKLAWWVVGTSQLFYCVHSLRLAVLIDSKIPILVPIDRKDAFSSP